MQTVSTSPRLLQLREQLDLYRIAGKRAVFPDKLKQQAVSLLDDYPQGTIITALAISSSSLNRWRGQFANLADGRAFAATSPAFMSLPSTTVADNDTYPLTLTLEGPEQGNQVILQCHVTSQQWRELLGKITEAVLS